MGSLREIQNYPIRTSIGAILGIITVIWALYRPVLIEDLSADFVTKAELIKQTDIVTRQLRTLQGDMTSTQAVLGGLVTQVNVTAAFQMERGFQEDLDKHEADRPRPVTSRWLETERDLIAKRDLANQYKNCVLNERKNCDMLQKQLWQ